MRNRRFWTRVRNIGFALILVNQALILPINIRSFYEEMFQRNELSVATHEIWSEYGRDTNMRKCPKLSCDVVKVLPNGTEIQVSGQVHGEKIEGSGVWSFVNHDGLSGYVFDRLVREIDQIT